MVTVSYSFLLWWLLLPGFLSSIIITTYVSYQAMAQELSLSEVTLSNNFSRYSNPVLGIKMEYPITWIRNETNNSVSFSMPSVTAPHILKFAISVFNSTETPLDRLVGRQISSYKQSYTDFSLTNFAETNIASNPAYALVYTFRHNQHNFKMTEFWIEVNHRVYLISYRSEQEGNSYFEASAQKMINSLEIQSTNGQVVSDSLRKLINLGQITDCCSSKYNVAVNPVTSKLYTTGGSYFNSSERFNSIFTVDIPSGSQEGTGIRVGDTPAYVAVNPFTNRVYVSNLNSNNVSVIDGSTNKVIYTIPVGKSPIGMAIDPDENLLYVANSESHTVSVINGSTNKVESNIPIYNAVGNITLGTSPVGLAVNPITKRLYVCEPESNTISVIDYFVNKSGGFEYSRIANVMLGDTPAYVAVNPFTNRVYVSNLNSNNVSVIDGSTNKVIYTIPVGTSPFGLAVNPYTNTVYVANSNNVSIIDGSTNKVHTIPTTNRSSSWQTAVDPISNMTYVSGANIIFEINKTNDVTRNLTGSIKVKFNIYPPSINPVGDIICNEQSLSALGSDHFIFDNGTQILCTPLPYRGYGLAYWYDNEIGTIRGTIINRTVSHQMEFSAVFKPLVPYTLIILVMVAAATAIGIHTIHWLVTRYREKRRPFKPYDNYQK